MRALVLTTAVLLASGSAALAAPPTVSVTVGPDLQKKAAEKYGVREVDQLADSLRKDVERQLARTGAYDGGRVDLILADAVPNRPTFKQLGDTPGLSITSFGVGGARIEGQAISADGRATSVSYKWYETDIRQSPRLWTWTDAETTFDRFARHLGKGEQVAAR